MGIECKGIAEVPRAQDVQKYAAVRHLLLPAAGLAVAVVNSDLASRFWTKNINQKKEK